ncbi:MAG: erythromycin esterase family protein [Gemmatimonadota bacterium]|jgi:erythromycin esterase
MFRHGLPALLVTLASLLVPSLVGGQSTFRPVVPGTGDAIRPDELEALGRAIGGRRIVLLGENGHGVGEFTTAKVGLVEWLRDALSFEVVVMESGFFECAHAWDGARRSTPRRLLYDCLKYPFQHAEILPLFERIRDWRDTERPLELAGMDLQAQGFDSGDRPEAMHAVLSRHAPALARRVAAYDSALYLVADSGGMAPEALRPWLLEHHAEVRAAYDSAAALTAGTERWTFELSVGLVDRLLVSARAEVAGTGRPPRYGELRDEWMARAVAAVADSIAGARKVVVWLHNDHARYGANGRGDERTRTVGGYLREWYGDEVFSIGFFMGQGVIADNGRTERQVDTPPENGVEAFLGSAGYDAGYLILTGSRDPEVIRWASSPRGYLRAGLTPREMVPADEFDALFWVRRVGPPEYSIPDPSLRHLESQLPAGPPRAHSQKGRDEEDRRARRRPQ